MFVESFNVPRHEFLGKYDDLYWKNKAVLFEAILGKFSNSIDTRPKSILSCRKMFQLQYYLFGVMTTEFSFWPIGLFHQDELYYPYVKEY